MFAPGFALVEPPSLGLPAIASARLNAAKHREEAGRRTVNPTRYGPRVPERAARYGI